MSALEWDALGERLYETGVSNGVLYPWDPSLNEGKGGYGKGVAWNGLTAVNESPEGAESNDLYADNVKYLSLLSAEKLKATIEAYMYPDEFAECDGSAEITDGVFIGQQSRKSFAFAYKTIVGNDTDGDDHGYKIHIIYGCKASPSEKGYSTVNDSPEAISFSWEVSTTPVNVTNHKPTALATIDSTVLGKEKAKKLTDILWGSASSEPRVLLPDEIVTELAKG